MATGQVNSPMSTKGSQQFIQTCVSNDTPFDLRVQMCLKRYMTYNRSVCRKTQQNQNHSRTSKIHCVLIKVKLRELRLHEDFLDHF